MQVRFFNPGFGYIKIKPEIDRVVERVLTNGDLVLRQDVEDFEKNLASFVGTKYAVGLNSGTDALYLALKAYDIHPGDEVLVPSHTFVATAQVVAQLGAVPVLYDLGEKIQVSPKTVAVMPAHIAGEFGYDMTELMEVAKRHDLIVIEDACQALGATQKGKAAGAWGDAAAFSFYPAKILGGFGDAGALVTNHEGIYNEVIELRNHYKKDYSKWGINSRLDNLQAAVLNVKLRNLRQALLARQFVAQKYNTQLAGLPVGLPEETPGRVWQDYILRTPRRDDLYEFLKREGIETMKNEYPFPITKGPVSLKFEAETLRLPCNELLTTEEIDYVIAKVKEFYGDKGST
jgi:dTDP-4-amino-4,6-dideoxygalactose transaminase